MTWSKEEERIVAVAVNKIIIHATIDRIMTKEINEKEIIVEQDGCIAMNQEKDLTWNNLKEALAIYQQVMNAIFHDIIGRKLEI